MKEEKVAQKSLVWLRRSTLACQCIAMSTLSWVRGREGGACSRVEDKRLDMQVYGTTCPAGSLPPTVVCPHSFSHVCRALPSYNLTFLACQLLPAYNHILQSHYLQGDSALLNCFGGPSLRKSHEAKDIFRTRGLNPIP